MIHLVYISSATKWPTEEELTTLLEQARRRNEERSITGMLLYDNATYLQVLEGDANDVHEIFKSINNDPRTTGIVKLIEEEISERDFPEWNMGFKNLENYSPDDLPGYSDIFNGNLNIEIAEKNKRPTIQLIMNFAKVTD